MRALKAAPGFGAHLYVMDVVRRTRPVRILGSLDAKLSLLVPLPPAAAAE